MGGSPALPKNIRIEHIWCLAVVVGVFAFLNTQPIRPNDFWWQLAAGRDISNTHQILTVDTYSYTEFGQSYPAYQIFWFVEIGYYWLYRAGGLALIIFTHSLVVTLAYLLLLFINWQLSHNWRVSAFCTLFAAVLGISDWNVRPQALTFVIGALFLTGIYACRRKKQLSWLVVFPLGMLVWANSHGSFLIGLALLGIWTLDEIKNGLKIAKKEKISQAIKPLIYPTVALGVSILAITANPSGLGILNYVLGMMKNSVIQTLVPEWAPPSIYTFEGAIFWGAFIICLGIILFSIRHLSFFQGVMFLVFGGLAIKTSRWIVWFGIVMAPILADLINRNWVNKKEGFLRPLPAQRTGLNTVFVILLGLMAVASLPWFKAYLPLPEKKAGLISSETPIDGTNYLIEHHLPGPVFNNIAFGSYLIWAAQPDYKVFVDPRLELYSLSVWQDYIMVGQGQDNWEKCLNRYGIKTLFLNPSEEANLVRLAMQSKKWSMVYQDTHSIIFVKE